MHRRSAWAEISEFRIRHSHCGCATVPPLAGVRFPILRMSDSLRVLRPKQPRNLASDRALSAPGPPSSHQNGNHAKTHPKSCPSLPMHLQGVTKRRRLSRLRAAAERTVEHLIISPTGCPPTLMLFCGENPHLIASSRSLPSLCVS